MEISIKKEDLQKKSLFVATPMYGGMNHGLYMKACLDLQGLCMQYGVNVKFSFLKIGDPYRAYYDSKIYEYSRGQQSEK